MTITDSQGRTPEQHVHDILLDIKRKLDTSGKVIQSAVSQTVKRHFQTIYPGSKHYSPSNVENGAVAGSSAVVVVDVPGITRAYHNLDIKAKRAKHLTIPMHRQAYGLPASAFEDLFYLKTKSGTEMLAKNEGGALVFMYLLKEKVHQTKDPRLMPSDQTIVDNIAARIWAYLQRS